MNRSLVRRTLIGALLGAAVFGGVALLQALRSDAPLLRVVQPLLLFSLLGLTLGGLAGPMVGQALANLSRRRRG